MQSVEALVEKFDGQVAARKYDAQGEELFSSRIRRAVQAHALQAELERNDPRLRRDREERQAREEAEARAGRVREHEARFWAGAEDAFRAMGLRDRDMQDVNGADPSWPALAQLAEWARGADNFCVIGGDPDSGKSVAACWVLVERCREYVKSESFEGWFWRPGWGKYAKVSELARFSYYAKSDRDYLERLGFCRWLVLDDLGAEQMSDTWRATLFELMEERSRNKVRTVITTNLTGPALLKRYDSRVMRRFFDYGLFIAAKRPAPSADGVDVAERKPAPPPSAAAESREPGSEG